MTYEYLLIVSAMQNKTSYANSLGHYNKGRPTLFTTEVQ